MLLFRLHRAEWKTPAGTEPLGSVPGLPDSISHEKEHVAYGEQNRAYDEILADSHIPQHGEHHAHQDTVAPQ